ncbi:unnamed protein product [Caenorhabditis nigoni]
MDLTNPIESGKLNSRKSLKRTVIIVHRHYQNAVNLTENLKNEETKLVNTKNKVAYTTLDTFLYKKKTEIIAHLTLAKEDALNSIMPAVQDVAKAYNVKSGYAPSELIPVPVIASAPHQWNFKKSLQLRRNSAIKHLSRSLDGIRIGLDELETLHYELDTATTESPPDTDLIRDGPSHCQNLIQRCLFSIERANALLKLSA